MKVYCPSCGRQVVSHEVNNDRAIEPGPCKVAIGGYAFCRECSKDLDENGMFPEERVQVE